MLISEGWTVNPGDEKDCFKTVKTIEIAITYHLVGSWSLDDLGNVSYSSNYMRLLMGKDVLTFVFYVQEIPQDDYQLLKDVLRAKGYDSSLLLPKISDVKMDRNYFIELAH
jgi:hypothetical protein